MSIFACFGVWVSFTGRQFKDGYWITKLTAWAPDVEEGHTTGHREDLRLEEMRHDVRGNESYRKVHSAMISKEEGNDRGWTLKFPFLRYPHPTTTVKSANLYAGKYSFVMRLT